MGELPWRQLACPKGEGHCDPAILISVQVPEWGNTSSRKQGAQGPPGMTWRRDLEVRLPGPGTPYCRLGGWLGYAQDSGCCYLTMVRTLSIQETAQIRLKRHETGVLCSPLLSTEASRLRNGGAGSHTWVSGLCTLPTFPQAKAERPHHPSTRMAHSAINTLVRISFSDKPVPSWALKQPKREVRMRWLEKWF